MRKRDRRGAVPEGMGAITLVIATKAPLRGRTPKSRQPELLYTGPERLLNGVGNDGEVVIFKEKSYICLSGSPSTINME